MAKYTFNIVNHIRRLRNDVANSYNEINSLNAASKPMPSKLNIGNLANTIRNINMGMNHVKERSHNGEDYRRLFYNYDNEILDLDGLKISNLLYADDMFLNAVNLSDSSVENIINWIPNYTDLNNPWTDTLEYFGIDQNLRDNISANIDENVVIPKGWRVRDYYNYIIAYTSRNPDPNILGDEPEVTTKFFQESAENGWQKRLTVVTNNQTGATRLVQNNANWIREQLKSIYPVILNLDGTAGTKDFSQMFSQKTTLKEVHGLNISNAENIYMMFANTKLNRANSIDNCNFNTSKVINAAYAFYDSGLRQEKMVFNLPNCTNISYMFATSGVAPVSIKEIELQNTQNISSWSSLAWGSYNIEKITGIDLSGTTSGYGIFDGVWGLKEIGLDPNSTRRLTTISYMFNKCQNLVNFPNFLTNNVTNAYLAFNGCSNMGMLPNYNFINLENAGSMFNGAGMTTIPSFNFSNVSSMAYTFNAASKLNQLPALNTGNVLYFIGTFQGCQNLSTIPLINTNRGTYFQFMFNNCFKLNNIANINLNRGVNFYNFFTNCYNLRQVNQVYNFNKATNMACMFNQCYNLTMASINNIINMLPDASTFENDVYFEDMHENRLGYFGILNWYLAKICNTSMGDKARAKGYNLTNNVRDLTLKYIYDYNTVSSSTLNTVEVFETFENHTEDINIGMLNQSFNDLPRDTVKYLNMTYIADTSNIPGLAKDMSNLIEVPNIHRIEMMFRVDSAFANCTNLTKVSNINLFNCISASYMFDNCQNLTTLNNFHANRPRKMRKMTSAAGMFRNCRKLGNLDLSLLDFSGVSSADEVFANCILMNNFDNIWIGGGGSINRAFADIPNLTTLNNIKINGWYGASNIFQNDIKLVNITNSIINTGYGGNYAFAELTNLKNLENTKIYAGNNSVGMFKNCRNITSFENILLNSGSSTTNGKHTSMFEGCSNLQAGIFAFTGSNDVSYAYANCTNMTEVKNINMASATNILNIFYGVNKLINNALYNIINGLPRYEEVRSANGGHGATLGYLGINNSKDHNLPWNISKPARDKGWLLGDIAHIITGNYINGNNYVFNVYDAPDHKDVSNNGAFIREALTNNARYIPFIQSITINNTSRIQDWSKFFNSSSANNGQWINLKTINANMNNVINAAGMFWNCQTLKTIGNHSFSNIDNGAQMFGYVKNISQQLNINFSKIVNTVEMFESATGDATFNQTGSLNIINSTNAYAMFEKSTLANRFNGLYAPNCEMFNNIFSNSNIEYLNTLVINNAMNTNSFASNAKQLKQVGDIKLDKHLLSPFRSGFFNCSNLISVGNFSSPNGGTAYDYTFSNCQNLTTIGTMTWTSAARLLNTFANCYKLQDFNLIAPRATTLEGTFANCTNITKISEILHNMPNITTLSSAFKNTGITNLQNIILEKCVNIHQAFHSCLNLQTIDGFKVKNFSASIAFASCPNLTTVNNFQIERGSSLSSLFLYDHNLKFINNSIFNSDGNGNQTFLGCLNLQALTNVAFIGSVITTSHVLGKNCLNLRDIIDCDFHSINNIKTHFPNSPIANIINTKLDTFTDTAFEYFKNNPNLVQVKNVTWNSSNIYGFNTQNNNQPMPSWSANLFMNDINLTDVDIDVSNISNLSYYFKNDNKLVNINLQNLKPNANLTYAFSNTGLTNLNILSNIITSTPSPYLFSGCLKLNDISAWNNRTILTGTFDDCPLITTTPNNVTITGGISFKGCPNITNVLPLTIGVNQVFKYFPNSNNLTSTSLDNIANGLFNYKLVSNKTALKNSVVNILTDAQIANLSDYAKETIAHKYWIVPGYIANVILTTDIGNTSCVVNTNGFVVLNTSITQASTINLTFFNGVSNMSNTIINQNHLHTLSIDSCENVKDINNALKNVPLLTNLSGMDDLGLAFTNDTTIAQRTLNIAAAANLTMNSVNNLLNAIAYIRPESHINLNRNVLNLVNENTKRLINYKGWTLDGYTQNTPAKVIDLVTNREVFNLRTKHGGWLPAIDTNGKIYLHSTTKRDGTSDEMSLTITNRIGNTLNIIMNSSSEKGWDYLIVSKNGTEIYNAKKLETNNNNTPLNLSGLNVGDILTFNYTKDSSGSYGIDEYQLYFEQDLIE